jgi:phosphoglucosamine mutase
LTSSAPGSMRKLFGTDGIRGAAGQQPLDDATVLAVGRALGNRLPAGASRRVVIGQDTRESSPHIARLLGAGLVAAGVEVRDAGVITTPGVAYLARTGDFAAGVVISASHNPWHDNGIKVFGHDGYKLPDAVELELEREIFAVRDERLAAASEMPATASAPQLCLDYEQYLASVVEPVDSALRVVVDCANGAASPLAPVVFGYWQFAGLGFTHSSPNGRNINQDCGALHPEVVAREVVAQRAGMGVTFDGDADRALFADAQGRVVNGDAILLLAARWMKKQGRLRNDTVVATTMSNMGLEIALKQEGIRMLRAPVGDKYVLQEMQRTGANLGGEQSGHIIFLDYSTTGDGLLTALVVLHIVAESGKPLAELVSDLKVFPQTIRNVRVREKQPLAELAEVISAIKAAERELDGNGRVNVRYSGTEMLCRVMVEAESEDRVQRVADGLVKVIETSLG